MRIVGTLFLLLIGYSAHCQVNIPIDSIYFQGDSINQYNEQGLKIGKWIYLQMKVDSDSSGHLFRDYRFTQMGYYKIIYIEDTSKYADDKPNNNSYWHKSQAGEYFHYSGKNGHYFSVPDGLWLSSVSNGEIKRIDDWHKGFRRFSYELSKGELRSVTHDYIRDSLSTTDTYNELQNLVFKRDQWKNGKRSALYYPNSEINLKDNSLHFLTTLGTSDTMSVYIYSNSNKQIWLQSFRGFSDQIKLYDENFESIDSLQVAANDSTQLNVVYTPKRNQLHPSETIYFRSDSLITNDFKITISTGAFDLHRQNVDSLEEIKLNKNTENLYLYVSDVGWHTELKILTTDRDILKEVFLGEGRSTRIDISNLPEGMYQIFATSDKVSHQIDLIIE